MALAELVILDVGHGNAAVILDDDKVVIVDVGTGDALLSFLTERGIHHVDALLISHADADHIAGAATLLIQDEISVRKVRVNPDAKQDSDTWNMFRSAVKFATDHYPEVDVRPEITTSTTQDLDLPNVVVEVLHPPPAEALGGVGGRWISGKAITANGLSAVVKVSSNGRAALLCGDIDAVGLDVLMESDAKLEAELLVFPHHGGRPGALDTPASFATRLCDRVGPQTVVFSNGRGRFNMPRPDIVRAVVDALPKVHIACTQLSELCAAAVPGEPLAHITALPASGRVDNKCCAGTIVIEFSEQAGNYLPSSEAHREFVRSNAPSALCSV